MKKILTALLLTNALVISTLSHATTILAPPPGEPELINDILIPTFGASNYTRINDAFDQVWIANGTYNAEVLSSNGDYDEVFGIVTNGTLNPLFTVSNNTLPVSANFTFSGQFSFGLAGDYPPVVYPPFYSSLQSSNPFGEDHMVSFRIDSGFHAGSILVAWEDLAYDITDNDFNDLVVLISATGSETPHLTNVPVPASAWLMLSGLLGLASFAKRKYA